MEPGNREDLFQVIQTIRAMSDEEALQALQSVIREAKEKGYAAGLVEGTTEGLRGLTTEEIRRVVWARHQKELAAWGMLADGMVDGAVSPDFTQATKAVLAALTYTHNLLLGIAAGVTIPTRVKLGDTLDCFRFKEQPGA